MRYILLILILLSGLTGYGQSPTKIAFDYDDAGNQTVRRICVSCQYKSSNDVKNIEDVTSDDLQDLYPDSKISYYPNPVKEQLYLKWKLTNEVRVSSIKLYSLTGQQIKSFENLNGKDSFVLNFSDLPQNVYTVILVYSNGEEKPFKIIKN